MIVHYPGPGAAPGQRALIGDVESPVVGAQAAEAPPVEWIETTITPAAVTVEKLAPDVRALVEAPRVDPAVFAVEHDAAGGHGTIHATGALYERGRPVPLGAWIDLPYAPGTYTALAPMTWTVEAADQVAYRYTLIGKTVCLTLTLVNTTIGGTRTGSLFVTAPLPIKTDAYALARLNLPGNVDEIGWMQAQAGQLRLLIARNTAATFPLGTNAISVLASIVYETP